MRGFLKKKIKNLIEIFQEGSTGGFHSLKVFPHCVCKFYEFYFIVYASFMAFCWLLCPKFLLECRSYTNNVYFGVDFFQCHILTTDS